METASGPAAPSPPTCTATTASGTPCRAAAMAGGKACVHHAGLARTEAQREASRNNPLQHGARARGVRDDEWEVYRAYQEAIPEPDALKRDQLALILTRRDRVMELEAHAEDPVAYAAAAARALDAAGRALDRMPDAPPPKPEDDPILVAQIVQDLSRDPEIFLKRLHPDVQEEIRGVLRRAGAIG